VSKYYYQIYNTKAITDGEGPWKQVKQNNFLTKKKKKNKVDSFYF